MEFPNDEYQQPEVIRQGIASLQVCVPYDWTDEQIVEFANRRQMTGLDHGWSIRRQGDPALKGDAERVCCADTERVGFCHVMLSC